MKKILTTGAALALTLLCSVNAFATEVPTGTVIQNLNGVQQYIKTYMVSSDTDPQSLIEDPFQYEGFVYVYSSMTKEEHRFSEHTYKAETLQIDTAKKDLSTVLGALSPSVEYDDGYYRGTLYLDHSTINTVASDYATKSYTVSETKEIDGLDRNDMAYVPSTAIKDGVTIQLQAVEWQVQATALVDDVLVPSQYKAVAHYAGQGYYRAATSYITTAEYRGEVTAAGVDRITYTVTYVGETTAPAVQEKISGPFAMLGEHWPLLVCSAILAVLAAVGGGLVCTKRMKAKVQTVPFNEENEVEYDED